MKYKIALVISLALFLNQSCRRCYFCFALEGTFVCHKGTDTTYFFAGSRRAMMDSINYYKGNGFIVDTADTFYAIEDQGAQICVHSQYKGFIDQGDSCTDNVNP